LATVCWWVQRDPRQYPHSELTDRIIRGFLAVHHELGFGHLEALYRRALAVELRNMALDIRQEFPFEMVYRGVVIGSYRADLVVESKVIVEAKAGLALDPTARAQVLTYLSASRLSVGLVLHFGPKPVVRRVVLSRRPSGVEGENGR
jgi:GxxExxY protein